jgi:putative tryptophan/tyrosine transport system substrate-binding protein
MLDRRRFLAAALAVLPGVARAQRAGRQPKIGVLWHAGSVEEEGKYYVALVDSLRALGFEHGRTAIIEHRFPAEETEKFERFAQELVALDVDVLVAVTVNAAVAAKRATRSIPIVFLIVADPVAAGLVTSLSDPGGNVTGFSNIATDLTAKRLQLFKEVVGNLSKVALLVNPTDAVTTKRTIEEMAAAGATLNLSITPFEVQARSDLESVLLQVARSGAEGFAVAQNPVFFNQRKFIADIALRHRLPSTHVNGDAVDAGFLMSYGTNAEAIFRRTPTYVQRILKGAKPRELPVEQPTVFELVVNLKTAKLLGLAVPRSVLDRADRLVE